MAVDDGAEIAAGRLIQPKVEAEIAFVLGDDLPHADTTPAEVLRAIEFAVAAIEVVDSRIADWQISFHDTVADNGSSGLYVVGSRPVSMSRLRPDRVRDGDRARRGAGLGRRRCRLSRQPRQRRRVAGAHDGRSRPSALGGRHHLVRRARPDGPGPNPGTCSKPGSPASERSPSRSQEQRHDPPPPRPDGGDRRRRRPYRHGDRPVHQRLRARRGGRLRRASVVDRASRGARRTGRRA